MNSSPNERRQSKRLDMRLPIEVERMTCGSAGPLRATTRNVSAGGVYFELSSHDLSRGQEIRLQLNVPPGEGYFPYSGQVRGDAEVVRVEPLPANGHGPARLGVAARFRSELKIDFPKSSRPGG